MNSLTAADINSILEVCAKTNVSELQFGELKVSFGAKTIVPEIRAEDLNVETHEKMTEEELQRQAAYLREQQIQELLLTKPELYEEMMLKGELVDDSSVQR